MAIIVRGKACYCFTTKTNESGNYPSHCYEAHIIAPEVVKIGKDEELTADEFIHDFAKERDGVTHIKIANSQYPFYMQDRNGNKIEPISVKNDTNIELAVAIKNNKEGKPYLVCNGIKVLDDIKPYNPFDFD